MKYLRFLFSLVRYRKVEKCSFLTNDSAWFKNFTLAINYWFLFFDECTNIIMSSFHLFLIFFSLCLYASWSFFKIKSFHYNCDLWYVNLESKSCKTLSTHSLIGLSSKFWYQLLTMALSMLRKLDITNQLFMW